MQYGGSYNIDSTNNGYTDVLKRVNGRLQRETENMHHDMKRHYRQVSMGFGGRSDFTKMPQQGYDPGFVYDQNKLHSINYNVSRRKENNPDKHSFGANYDRYDKSVVAEGLQHWTGRGPACNMANDGAELSVVKKRVQTYATVNRDRGLLIKSGQLKQQKTSKVPGPGSYNTVD